MDFDWKAIVRTVAPTIASVFGTPLAGMGVTAILNAIIPADQPRPDNPEEYLGNVLAAASPETMMKIKQADAEFKTNMKKLDIDLEKFLAELAAKDVANARDLKVNWLKSDKWDYEMALAAVVVLCFVYAEYWVFNYALATHTMEPNQAILIGRILGTVEGAFLLLLNFRWGTSRSSERKTEIDAAKAMANPKQ